MKIKDHVSLVIWPPVWTTGVGDASPPSGKDEELILRKAELVHSPQIDTSRGYIRLLAEFEEETQTRTSVFTGKTITSTKPGRKTYLGIVTILRDPEFLEQFYRILQNSIGHTIREIGDLEIEVT